MFFATKKIPAPGLADGQSNYKTMIAKILSPGGEDTGEGQLKTNFSAFPAFPNFLSWPTFNAPGSFARLKPEKKS
jgi:hypothetical protein